MHGQNPETGRAPTLRHDGAVELDDQLGVLSNPNGILADGVAAAGEAHDLHGGGVRVTPSVIINLQAVVGIVFDGIAGKRQRLEGMTPIRGPVVSINAVTVIVADGVVGEGHRLGGDHPAAGVVGLAPYPHAVAGVVGDGVGAERRRLGRGTAGAVRGIVAKLQPRRFLGACYPLQDGCMLR